MKKTRRKAKGIIKHAIKCLTKPTGTTFEYGGEKVNRFVYVIMVSRFLWKV